MWITMSSVPSTLRSSFMAFLIEFALAAIVLPPWLCPGRALVIFLFCRGIPPGQLKGVRVMVVDDNPDAMNLVKHLLEQCGVTVAGSPRLAAGNQALVVRRAGAADSLP